MDNNNPDGRSVSRPDNGRESGVENVPNASLPNQSQQTTKCTEDSLGRKKRKSLYGRTVKGRNRKKKECPAGRAALNAEVEHRRCLLAKVRAARLAAEGERAQHVFERPGGADAERPGGYADRPDARAYQQGVASPGPDARAADHPGAPAAGLIARPGPDATLADRPGEALAGPGASVYPSFVFIRVSNTLSIFFRLGCNPILPRADLFVQPARGAHARAGGGFPAGLSAEGQSRKDRARALVGRRLATAGSFRGDSVRGPTTFILLSFQPCPSPRRCLFFLVFDRRGRISMGWRCSSARIWAGRRCSQFPRARRTGTGLRGIAAGRCAAGSSAGGEIRT